LYRRNAIGGIVNFYTKKPTNAYEGYASVDYGNYGYGQHGGAVNVPVSEKVQIRAASARITFRVFFETAGPMRAMAMTTRVARPCRWRSNPGRIHGVIYGQYLNVGGNGRASRYIHSL